MSCHAYPRSATVADLARAAAGAALAGLPLVLVDTAPVATALLALIVAVFVAYGLLAAARHLSRVEVDETGIHQYGPVSRWLAWRDVKRVKLAYYSTRRDRSGGWLQLSLFDGRRRLHVDSRIDGFASLAADAAAAAGANGLRLEPATIANLRALGIAPDDAREP